MSQIKEYLLEKQQEAEAVMLEIDMRFHVLTGLWGIENPEMIVAVLDDPLSTLLEIRKELVRLGGLQAASGITLPWEITTVILKEKTWQAVRDWYEDRGLEMDIEQSDYISKLHLPRPKSHIENN